MKCRKVVMSLLWTTEGGRSNTQRSCLKDSFNLIVIDFILKGFFLSSLNYMKLQNSQTACV